MIISLWVAKSRADEGASGPLLPSFVVLFFVLAGLNSMGWIPATLVKLISEASSWGLLIAIAAVGMKTSFKGFWSSGSTVFYLVIAETLLLAAIFVGAIHWMGLTG